MSGKPQRRLGRIWQGAYIGLMKRMALILGLLIAAPVAAQESDGPSLMERGAQLFLEGLLKEVEPMTDELGKLLDEAGPAMQSFVEKMGPALSELMQDVEDWSAYEPPEVLPNGDIIIRRKQSAPEEALPDGEVEL